MVDIAREGIVRIFAAAASAQEENEPCSSANCPASKKCVLVSDNGSLAELVQGRRPTAETAV